MRLRSVVALWIVLCFAGVAQAQESSGDKQSPLVSRVMLYVTYAQQVRENGAEGFKALSAKKFTLKEAHQTWTGAKAFAELGKYFTEMNNNSKNTLRVEVGQLNVTGDLMIAMTKEDVTLYLGDIEAKNHSRVKDVSAIYTLYQKHTWHKFGQDWKLEQVEVTDEAAWKKAASFKNELDGRSFTVSSAGYKPGATSHKAKD